MGGPVRQRSGCHSSGQAPCASSHLPNLCTCEDACLLLRQLCALQVGLGCCRCHILGHRRPAEWLRTASFHSATGGTRSGLLVRCASGHAVQVRALSGAHLCASARRSSSPWYSGATTMYVTPNICSPRLAWFSTCLYFFGCIARAARPDMLEEEGAVASGKGRHQGVHTA